MHHLHCPGRALAIAAGLCMIALLAHGQALPPGHPPTGGQRLPETGNPADVATVDAIMRAYYDALSGPAGQPRDWDRYRSLFLPNAQMATVRAGEPVSMPFVLTPDQFIDGNRVYFEKSGYFEVEFHRQTDTFGNIAQVLSTYASRRAMEDPEPYARGMNSFQLIRANDRWWIVSVIWDYERPAENPIPEKYGGTAH